jgi:hypothetical protein
VTEPEGSLAGLFIANHEELIARDDLGILLSSLIGCGPGCICACLHELRRKYNGSLR